MAKSNIAPTKSNLLAVKAQLAVSQDGYELLEQKREILVMELMRMVLFGLPSAYYTKSGPLPGHPRCGRPLVECHGVTNAMGTPWQPKTSIP